MASGRPSKRTLVEFLDNNAGSTQKIYRFQILLPNGMNVRLILQDPGDEMFIDEFVHAIRKEAEKVPSLQRLKRKVLWDQDIYLEALFVGGYRIRKKISFSRFMPNKLHILRLHDGAANCVNTYQNMWDLTPHTDLLQELPAEYTFETALADLIDNSLQAVWSNDPNERRLISVTVNEHRVVIFDSGQGMDGSDENSITKWGKMGSSNHRESRKKAIGYNAPYLVPYFGMFGYGGPIASMHLGKLCIVTSKTKASREVCILKLSREALLNQSTPKCIWMTDGAFREPSEVEMQASPHGSFTMVEIRELKLKCLESYKLQCLIKDIYFPYIQFDEKDSRKTTMPIEFEVNGTNLAEIHGGEVALTNLLSCNGPDFTFEVKFVLSQRVSSHKSFDSTSIREANARLKCVYFPIVEGKENIERILEKLEEDDCGIKENFDNFARVSVRRLGRLFPDSRWNPLPFMDAKHKRGDKAQLLKRCCKRVKCFIETDAGFSPTPSKTDLAHHDPFTLALKSFNFKPSEKESEMSVVIFKDKKKLSLCQMEKEFKDWVNDMHDRYDEEIVCGEDEPVLVVGLSDKKRLGVTSEVVRVHHVIKRKGTLWKSGQKVKILKGAVGCPNNNMYATLEYILIEGFQGDAGGEARLICRPIDCCEKGCKLIVENGNASLEIQGSISLPISVIDSGKIQEIDLGTWSYQLKRLEDKLPSKIEILTCKLAAQLGIHEELPIKTPVIAGCHPPKEIVAIIRPASFASSGAHDSLDQKFIVKDDFEMTLEIRWATGGKKSPGTLVYSESVKSSARNGFHGVYIFCLQQCSSKLFCNAGTYTFYFSTIVKGSDIKRLEAQAQVDVKPDLKDCQWRFVSDNIGSLNKRTLVTRVGSWIPYLSIGCFDSHSNQIPFLSVPQAIIKLHNDERLPACLLESKMALSSDQLLLEIRDIMITNHNLDLICPSYEVLLDICSKDCQFSAAVPCKVLPGPVSCVKMQGSSNFEECLAPGDVIEELMLDILDAYGNHIEEGVEVSIQVDGFSFVDNGGSTRKVNSEGQVNLNRALKVVSSFGSHVSFSVFSAHEKIFEKVLQVMKRELRVVSEQVDKNIIAGSRLENVIFEVFCPDGIVDVNIHGLCHTLTLHSEIIRIDDIQYTFQHGRCTVPVVPIPQEPGPFCFVAFHTHFPELQTSIMVHVIPSSPKPEMVDVTSLHFGLSYSPFHDDEILLLQSSSQNEPGGIPLLVVSMINDTQKLEEKVTQIALDVKESENKLKTLKDRKKEIEHETHFLEASIDPQYDEQLKLIANTKENIQKQVEGKDNTAAAVFCHLSKAMQIQESQVFDDHFMSDVVGVVALLGTVCDIRLSRIFAEFLGESNMLAIVCKSFKSALRLEKYREDGETDYQSALHVEAKRLSISISNRFTVFCLDEIKKFPGPIKDDPQRSLIFPKPNLKGRVPVGFLGRAVNMINLDTDHLNIKTSAGYGLRETLLYKLFGNVHVYRTWNDMLQAHPVIKNEGAVSLDGGIMRDSETILFGRNYDPDIIFPVSGPTVPENVIKMIRLKDEKKHQLEGIDQDTERELKVYADVKAKFYKTKAKLNKLLSKMASLQNNET